MTTRIRVLLVGDDEGVMKGLRMRLRLASDITIVAESLSPDAAIDLAQSVRPDIVLLDFNLASGQAIEICSALGQMSIAVVILGFVDETDAHRQCTGMDTVAFVSKQQSTDALLAALRRVHASR